MSEDESIGEVGKCWLVLGIIAEGYMGSVEKRDKAAKDVKHAEGMMKVHLADIYKYLKKLDSLAGCTDVREHFIWRLHEEKWDSSVIMKAFNLSKEEYDDIIHRKFLEFWEERVTRLRALPYKEYLKTPEWQETREKILSRDHYRCQLCNSTKRLNVHHKSYESIGDEHYADLITLCQDCHYTFHENRKLARVEA